MRRKRRRRRSVLRFAKMARARHTVPMDKRCSRGLNLKKN